MTCHHGFVTKKSPTPRLTHRKTRKLAVQTSSEEADMTNNDERRGYSPMMMGFHEFAIPADAAPCARAASEARQAYRAAA
jgi:hypothetical protein